MEKNPVVQRRVNEIDLLRFLAAFSVVLYHYTFRGYAADNLSIMAYPSLVPITKYGYLGVELFFLISGFVILMTASSGSLKRFAISRVVRLYPAFWVCCTLTFIAILLVGGERYSASLSQYLVNMTMLSEFFSVPSIDGVYWSLFVEIRFYALVALVLLIGQIHRAQSLLVAWLVVTVTLTLFPVSETLSRIFVVHYAPFFIAGAMCYLIYSNGLTPIKLLAILIAWVMALHNSVQDLQGMEENYQVDFNTIAVIAIVSTFFALIFLVSIGRMGPLGNRDWMAIGALTYPLYLIHQNIGFMMFNLAYPTVNRHLLLLGTIAIVVWFSYLVSHKLERRISRNLKGFLDSTFAAASTYLVRLKSYIRRSTWYLKLTHLGTRENRRGPVTDKDTR